MDNEGSDHDLLVSKAATARREDNRSTEHIHAGVLYGMEVLRDEQESGSSGENGK
jgi:hypothetical protein